MERWREHHRFKQLRRFNRKDCVSIAWLRSDRDLVTLSQLENQLIKLYKPPLNWSKVVAPVRKITTVEIALQQSLQQLAKFNTMIFGLDAITDTEPTIYLAYPVYGQRGISGGIRRVLRNINKKACALKWKEYQTTPKSSGKFGFWESEYNGLKIDLAPFQGLVDLMEDSVRRTVAGVELMAFSREQLEGLLENAPFQEEMSGIEVVEDDPIPLELVDKSPSVEGKNRDIFKIEWEELEPMPEGEVRVMYRQFLEIDGVEIEICNNLNGKYFVRHNGYWWIIYGQKNPDPKYACITENLKQRAERLPTIRWSGYRFRLETIVFAEDDVEVESALLPLSMFEDLLKDKSTASGLTDKIVEQIQTGEYKSSLKDSAPLKLFAWLQHNSLSSLLPTNNTETSPAS